MKSLLLTPTYFPRPTGNAVTVYRISRQLVRAGIACRIADLSALTEGALREQARRFAPDVLHCFHAWKTGRSGLKLKELLGVPLITTLTGTDINMDLADGRKRKVLLDVLAASEQVTVFNEQARALLRRRSVPTEKIRVIHQSVFFPRQQRIDYRGLLRIGERATVFLLLGSIRKVKNPGYAIGLLEKARAAAPDLHLIIAGPVLEQGEFLRLQALIGRKNWITYLGEVPRNRIRALLTCADVLLNTSASESEANAVLEAMSCAKIVIGKNIPGNASLLSDETGLLFDSKSECFRQILFVLKNGDKLTEMRNRARRRVGAAPFRFADEQAGYRSIYGTIGRAIPRMRSSPTP